MDDKTIRAKIEQIIWRITTVISDVVYFKNALYSVIRLLFVKYVTDNSFLARSPDEFKLYSRMQRTLSARDCDSGVQNLPPILRFLDQQFNLAGILENSLQEYSKDLFGVENSWQRKNASEIGYKRIMDVLADIDLEEKSDDHTIGNILVDELLKYIDYNVSKRGRLSGEIVSSPMLSKLASAILDVQDGDAFADFTSGLGTSTLQIVGDKNCKIFNADINEECTSLAAMLFILKGYTNFDIFLGDTLASGYDVPKANKYFVDAPIGTKVLTESGRSDAVVIVAQMVAQSMPKDAVAIITTPSNFLFQSKNPSSSTRQTLLSSGKVIAVVSLPPCWYGTIAGTNLMILGNNEKQKVTMINATSNKYYNFYSQKDRVSMQMTQEGVDLIAKIVRTGEQVEGVSRNVDIEEISRQNYSLSPAQYISAKQDESEIMTLSEVEEKLKELYQKLGL